MCIYMYLCVFMSLCVYVLMRNPPLKTQSLTNGNKKAWMKSCWSRRSWPCSKGTWQNNCSLTWVSSRWGRSPSWHQWLDPCRSQIPESLYKSHKEFQCFTVVSIVSKRCAAQSEGFCFSTGLLWTLGQRQTFSPCHRPKTPRNTHIHTCPLPLPNKP